MSQKVKEKSPEDFMESLKAACPELAMPSKPKNKKTGGGKEPTGTTAAEEEYATRYGKKTADEAAYELLERAHFRLSFLEKVLSEAHQDGTGFTLPGYDVCGLACILEDIAYDVYEARFYYHGEMIGECWGPEPGRVR